MNLPTPEQLQEFKRRGFKTSRFTYPSVCYYDFYKRTGEKRERYTFGPYPVDEGQNNKDFLELIHTYFAA